MNSMVRAVKVFFILPLRALEINYIIVYYLLYYSITYIYTQVFTHYHSRSFTSFIQRLPTLTNTCVYIYIV